MVEDLEYQSVQEWYEAMNAQDAMNSEHQPWWVEAKQASTAGGPEPAGADGAAGPGNTATYTRQQQWRVTGGVDKLEISCWGYYLSNYGQMCEKFEVARRSRAEHNGSSWVQVPGATLVIAEKGHRWANTFFRWVGEYDGIKLSFSSEQQAKGCQQAKVEIGSLKLMRDGHRACWEQALRMLQACGIVVEKTSVARIDLCVDLPGVSVAPFCEAVLEHRVVSRIKSEAHFYRAANGEWTGCAVGKNSSVVLRIYDKIAELKAHGQSAAAKEHVLVERRWGVLPTVATRVEFQVRGQWLRDKWGDCRSVESVFDRLDSIAGYLFTQYFRLVDGEVDRENRHQDRVATSALWDRVGKSFCEWVEREGLPLLKMERKPVDRSRAARRLVSAALGCAAVCPDRCQDRRDLVSLVCKILCHELPQDDREWIEKVEARWEASAARGDFGVFSFGGDWEFPLQLWEVHLEYVGGPLWPTPLSGSVVETGQVPF